MFLYKIGLIGGILDGTSINQLLNSTGIRKIYMKIEFKLFRTSVDFRQLTHAVEKNFVLLQKLSSTDHTEQHTWDLFVFHNNYINILHTYIDTETLY